MKQIRKMLALSVVASALVSPFSFAQDRHDDRHEERHDDHRDNHHFVHHNEWKRGEHMRREDWARGERVDYRRYHLRAPRRGYEWREVDGNFVMAAVATGVIATVIAESAAH